MTTCQRCPGRLGLPLPGSGCTDAFAGTPIAWWGAWPQGDPCVSWPGVGFSWSLRLGTQGDFRLRRALTRLGTERWDPLSG